MPRIQKPHLRNRSFNVESKKKRKQKQGTQKTPLQPVMIMKANGKMVMGWQEWPEEKKK